jgi:hypothetical protein
MKTAWKFAAVIGFAGLLGAALQLNSAQGRNMDIKQLMGNNFGYVQTILVNLIRSDYRSLPHDVGIIADHAEQLTTDVPDSVGGKDDLFLSMAYNLRTHANHLKLIVEKLGEHDQGALPGGKLSIDYLRNSAAAHFGQIVTTCVACHNQFRRRMLK